MQNRSVTIVIISIKMSNKYCYLGILHIIINNIIIIAVSITITIIVSAVVINNAIPEFKKIVIINIYIINIIHYLGIIIGFYHKWLMYSDHKQRWLKTYIHNIFQVYFSAFFGRTKEWLKRKYYYYVHACKYTDLDFGYMFIISFV